MGGGVHKHINILYDKTETKHKYLFLKVIPNNGFIYFVENDYQILENTGSVSLVTKIKRKCLILNGEKERVVRLMHILFQ